MMAKQEWTQLELDLGLDDASEIEDDDTVTESFIGGVREGRFGASTTPVAQTAFVVVIDAHGEAEAYADPRKFPLRTQRMASMGDIRRACNELVTEINLQTAARITVDVLAPGSDTTVRDAIRGALHQRGIDVTTAKDK